MRFRAVALTGALGLAACASSTGTATTGTATTGRPSTVTSATTTRITASTGTATTPGSSTVVVATVTSAVTSNGLPAEAGPVPAGVPPAAVPGPARAWIETTEDTVRLDKPGPPTSARRYAYVASAYAEARALGSPEQAGEVARRVLLALAPARADLIAAAAARLGVTGALPPAVEAVATRSLARLAGDGWTAGDPAAAMAGEPAGPGHWIRVGGAGPADATAGSWLRWLVPDGPDTAAPAPPAFGTPEYAQQQSIVADAVRLRDARWQAVIEFWGGTPGTQAPAGIWQDRLWTEAQGTALATDDLALARAQSALARTVADAFMACWRAKFTWWTARPSMSDPAISVAMANPPFPGYVSGHSTISAAAAAVLSWLVPERHDRWWADAAQARDSRLVAGIHFEIDNREGFALGTRVGNLAAARLKEGT